MRGTLGRSTRGSTIDSSNAIRGALEATVRVGAFVVNIMDIGDGILDARLGVADELATALEDLTKGLDVLIGITRRDTFVKLLVIVGQGICASIRTNTFTGGTGVKNAV